MDHSARHPSATTRLRVALVALLAAAGLLVAAASGPVTKADAVWTNDFCKHVSLPGYGTCLMGQGYANHYVLFEVITGNRAGCVSATGYHGEQVMGWACAAADGNAAAVYPPNPEGWYRGLIKNNHPSEWGHSFRGWAGCINCV